GGATWTEIKVSDAKFRPQAISGTATGYQGDYIGITSGNNRIIPNWADRRTGKYQSWAAIVDIGPSIAHTPLTNTELTTGNRAVNCVITPAGSPITPSTVKLYYSLNSPTLTSNVTMTNTSGDNWTANLPLSGAGLYRYYITATDGLSRTATYPSGAPANTVQFTASPDTAKPVIVTTPLVDVPKTTWPASVSASVTDNIGVDSVWVTWYKNNTGTGIKRFRLPFVSGTNYSAAFNSLPADVNVNDSIFYRVVARDASAAHNSDSTALYKFKIINLTNVCVGTGTTSSNYPFTTFWMDGRTQMLFTAAELTAAGIGPNSAFTKIGFNVLTASSQTMDGFNVKFQATTQTSLTAFVTTGTWFTGFSGSYAVPGTGTQNITMTNPYLWNGTSNLIIEICYDNAAYTSYSTVASTAAAGMTWGYYTDNSTGCTMVGGAVQASRPNVCFTFTSGVGVNPIGTELPKVYSLSQNYPNPFNPVTKINFALPKQGLVTLKIYDVLGREVRTLVNEVKSVGTYSVDFNASEFSSGVYFYKLESEGFSDIKRMMLIK
ncbi:MAG: T9SS type A sorting domain-containing protein, partial [Ignavibacteria bacterium]